MAPDVRERVKMTVVSNMLPSIVFTFKRQCLQVTVQIHCSGLKLIKGESSALQKLSCTLMLRRSFYIKRIKVYN